MKKLPVKKYKYTNNFDGKISKVQIIKETEHSVFFVGGGHARIKTQNNVYTDTPEEAFEWHKEKLRADMARRKRAYLYYKDRYDLFVEGGMICKPN
ncbi:MAG: hypothetical protein GY797_38965 [Deltaproteobacteria bacterium]|nr:hypothetical protein [Deltaproteobacteria bacterium]